MTTILRKRGIVHGDFPRKAEFVQGVRDCLAKARELYPEFTLSDEDLPVVFFNTGRCAGYARWKRGQWNKMVYNLEFNTKAIEIDWDDSFDDTIPHEVAHIVDRFINGKSSNHGPRWKRIARSLGCTGNRCHDLPLERSRKMKEMLYVATCGTQIYLSMAMHNKIQNKGQVRVLRSTRGKLSANEFTGKWKYKS